MADTFNLDEALAGLPPEKAKAVKEKWADLEGGFTKASQKAAEYDRLRPEWESREGQYRAAIQSFDTFFQQLNRESEGTVRNPATGRFESRKEQNVGLPPAWDPDEVGRALGSLIDSKLSGFKEEITGVLNKEKQEFGTQVYTNTGTMLTWERQLDAIERSHPGVDRNLITKTAREKGLRDMNDAYFLAYGRDNMTRIAKESAEKAAADAAKQTESRLRAEFTKHQIEGAGGLTGLSRRTRTSGEEAPPKTRLEAEAKATEELTRRMYSTPEA